MPARTHKEITFQHIAANFGYSSGTRKDGIASVAQRRQKTEAGVAFDPTGMSDVRKASQSNQSRENFADHAPGTRPDTQHPAPCRIMRDVRPHPPPKKRVQNRDV